MGINKIRWEDHYPRREVKAERDMLKAKLDDLRARLAAAEADAERYRWLRDGNDEKGTAAHRIAVRLYGFEWDDAIDKARGAQ